METRSQRFRCGQVPGIQSQSCFARPKQASLQCTFARKLLALTLPTRRQRQGGDFWFVFPASYAYRTAFRTEGHADPPSFANKKKALQTVPIESKSVGCSFICQKGRFFVILRQHYRWQRCARNQLLLAGDSQVYWPKGAQSEILVSSM